MTKEVQGFGVFGSEPSGSSSPPRAPRSSARPFSLAGAAAILALASLSAGGCSKDNNVSQSNQVDVGKQCDGPEDTGCGPGGVCVLGVCRHGCSTDAECAQGALCLGDRRPYGCSLPSELACSSHQPCRNSLACAPDGKCRMPCSATAQCPRNEHACIANVCVSDSEENFSEWQSCEGGAVRCEGEVVMACHDSRVGWAEQRRCNTAETCLDGACEPHVCTPEATASRCEGSQPMRCQADGLGLEAVGQPCAEACVAGACEPWVCEPSSVFCDGNSSVTCAADGLSEASRIPCAATERCVENGHCELTECVAGTLTCSGAQPRRCNASGDGYENHGAVCPEACVAGACEPFVCQPGSTFCQGNQRVVCAADGMSEVSRTPCASGETCVAGVCEPQVCTPESTPSRCDDLQPQRCRADGMGYEDVGAACADTCVNGACTVCTPDELSCNGQQPRRCQSDGMSYVNNGAPCVNGVSVCQAGSCVPLVCLPDAVSCDGRELVTCASDGLSELSREACEGTCQGGRCEMVDYPRWPMPGTPGHALDYTVNAADGTVLDNVTGLLWQRATALTTLTWANARSYCDGLVLGGRDDWRLPERIELVSLVDYTKNNPAVDGVSFPNVLNLGNRYWANTPQSASYQWYVQFSDGDVSSATRGTSQVVRCVTEGRSMPPIPSEGHFFEVNASDTIVTDVAAGLEWQRVQTTSRSWVNQGDYCNTLDLEGVGWRLPELSELLTLIDGRKGGSPYTLTTIFPTESVYYWSATDLVSNPVRKWVLRFSDADLTSGTATNPWAGRCVRSL
ncbi:MAG: DUF1566 domain-containing protein [Polyangiaceae bacterium]|nr:DUF1566 domain-containing protein [Polyangiaceae bacterium]MCW5791982.1 DUF1566 domain-containing protein [Polyangiaceae bacterium]